MPIFEPEARMLRQISKPSMSGSMTSSSATPMSSFSASRRSASSPVAASIGS